jgi:hypothetical protein
VPFTVSYLRSLSQLIKGRMPADEPEEAEAPME